jgi:hypothetical protein
MDLIQKHKLDLAAEFFFRFARFEYALKATGYHNESGGAKPDWKRFADELEKLFLNPADSKKFADAVNYYKHYPPKKQVIRNGELAWDAVEPNTNSFAHKILLYVCRVRNNLFHGGKFEGKYFAEPERSESLMKHGLIILDHCLSNNSRLYKAYEGE